MTQLEKAREEIATYQSKHYPYGECPECGFALDSNGDCTRGDYLYPDED